MNDFARKCFSKDKVFERIINYISFSASRNPSTYTYKSGHLWEDFCKMYLRESMGIRSLRPNECDTVLLSKLSLNRKDNGIDLIGIDTMGKYFAIQCKFRSNMKNIQWKELATFDALCARTGPWEKCIVMTTAKNIYRPGRKLEKDLIMNYDFFKKHLQF